MPLRRLIFLESGQPERVLLHEGKPLDPGSAVTLARKRSPWREGGAAERVIVGAHPSRADVLISGDGIFPEHARIYFPADGSPADLLVIHPASTRVDGRSVEPREWTQLRGGEELAFGSWRFRYEEVEP